MPVPMFTGACPYVPPPFHQSPPLFSPSIPMTEKQQRAAAASFAERWAGKGYEKGQSQAFWLDLLGNVLGVSAAPQYIEFENRIKLAHTSFIDGYIPDTRVLIEQKGQDIDLTRPIRQSDGTMLTPFAQAKRYAAELPYSDRPRWVVVCNFREFHVYDMEHPEGKPEVILLADLEQDYYRLQFLVDNSNAHLAREMKVSIQAGELVGRLYDAILAQYVDPTSPATLRSLNVLCVRLVFCLYAEDAGVFGRRDMFSDYLNTFPAERVRTALIELFEVLHTPIDQRDPYLAPALAAFPYVNGGLFARTEVEVPLFTEEIKQMLVNRAGWGFDWSYISPTIFGAVFESTLNPVTRRAGGMHYTSIENIHKVINPLFLDELEAEFAEALQVKVDRTRRQRLQELQDRLASLTFLDPACGSGNFLTETYLSLRRLENRILMQLYAGERMMGGMFNPVKVSIRQFYGIELNDFAVTVATTALWIAEAQMLQETERIVETDLNFLPLKNYSHIVEGNALQMDWTEVVPREELNYIIGNPPFVGYSLQSKEQKEDMLNIYIDEKGKPYKTAGKIDYVAGWYFKAAQLMEGTAIRAAFVSTNSISQGEQVAGVWKPLYDRFGIHIDFAYRTFRWDSEATLKAHVHCVIVGFSGGEKGECMLFDGEEGRKVDNINAYLCASEDVFVESRKKPICDVSEMSTGNRPADGGHLIIEAKDYEDFIRQEPNAQPYIRKFLGATEFINRKERYCLWLTNISPAELRKLPLVMKRVQACKEDRENAPDAGRRKLAMTPHLFREQITPSSTYILVPSVSSERREYVPMGFMSPDVICSNLVLLIPNATLYHFGILTSWPHMAWMRAICGRLKSDYRYSKDIVYNNYPWPELSTEGTDAALRAAIERTAQAILDARARYPDSSLADLYDPLTMPAELRRAHRDNDRAVCRAYGFPAPGPDFTETDCVARLFERYCKLTQ